MGRQRWHWALAAGICLAVLWPSAARANMPAPWAVCEGSAEGDSCDDSVYFPGGICVAHPADDCPSTDAGTCLWCESQAAGDDQGDGIEGDDDQGDDGADGAQGDVVGDAAGGPEPAPSGGGGGDDSGCSVASTASGVGLLGLVLLTVLPQLRRRRSGT